MSSRRHLWNYFWTLHFHLKILLFQRIWTKIIVFQLSSPEFFWCVQGRCVCLAFVHVVCASCTRISWLAWIQKKGCFRLLVAQEDILKEIFSIEFVFKFLIKRKDKICVYSLKWRILWCHVQTCILFSVSTGNILEYLKQKTYGSMYHIKLPG